MHEAFISLGSNQGERIQHLHAGVEALQRISNDKVRCSPVYETYPVGPVPQDKYLNLVVCVTTDLKPRALLQYLLDTELKNGRIRTIRFGPRTLDLDILLYDNKYVCFEDLQIPHPRMWGRAFVLVPLADLVPHRRGPGGRSIRDLATDCTKEGDVRYVGRFW